MRVFARFTILLLCLATRSVFADAIVTLTANIFEQNDLGFQPNNEVVIGPTTFLPDSQFVQAFLHPVYSSASVSLIANRSGVINLSAVGAMKTPGFPGSAMVNGDAKMTGNIQVFSPVINQGILRFYSNITGGLSALVSCNVNVPCRSSVSLSAAEIFYAPNSTVTLAKVSKSVESTDPTVFLFGFPEEVAFVDIPYTLGTNLQIGYETSFRIQSFQAFVEQIGDEHATTDVDVDISDPPSVELLDLNGNRVSDFTIQSDFAGITKPGTTAIPEPATFLVCGLGLGAIVVMRIYTKAPR
jgi:hypothetical protein